MTPRKKNLLIQTICTLFIFLFVYTAVSKLWSFHRFETEIYQGPIPKGLVPLAASILPFSELMAALLLLIPVTQLGGLWLSFGLMSFFAIYVGYMIFFIPHLPCSCGGIISSLSWKQHLSFNILFALMAVVGVALKSKNEIFIRINRISRTPV